MKIDQVKINSYGKLKNKEIEFKDKINLIYGKNETGKSTLLRFIVNSFYGISKNKKGKEFSDYDSFLPWTGEDFSGKINYSLDNGEKYEVFRDFKKKNPKIFNEEKEDISKNFNIDKAKGNEFFYEQTNMDEDIFLSTIVSYQNEVRLEKGEQNFLVQKIANLVGTGEDNVSYRIAMDRITRKQRDEIGSEKSREKPINVLTREIENLEEQKEELQGYESLKYNIEENKNNLENEINKLEEQKNYISELKKLDEKEKINKEKINIKEKIYNENSEKIQNLKNNYKKITEENNQEKNKIIQKNNNLKNKKKKINKIYISILIIFIIINILQFLIIKNKIINIAILSIIPILIIAWLITNKIKNKKIKINEKNNKKIIDEIKNEENNLKNEIEINEKNNKKIIDEINSEKNNFNLKNNLEKEKIKNKYKNKINENELNKFNNTENVNKIINNLQNNIANTKIQLHSLELDEENIEPKLENLSKIEEKLVNCNEKMLTLEKLNSSMNLAKEVLETAYQKMKNMVAPRFTKNLSQNISVITNGKYRNVNINDEYGLIVELEDGSYVEANKLSIGTIDQMYLSLRLSMIDELSEEKMPIFLDESFAYFDSDRLKNILQFLAENYADRQVLIFTCTDREKSLLMKLKVPFQFIEME